MNNIVTFWLTTGAVAILTSVITVFTKNLVNLTKAIENLTKLVHKLQINDAVQEIRIQQLENRGNHDK